MRRIRRYYPDFQLVATYTGPDGKLFAKQYRIHSNRKRVARRLFGVNLDGTQNGENGRLEGSEG
ncbi:hypothetical protein [Paenibacillus naphthalenovorans]|uniref:hypothetical protein n=1 Tax=Paenibacillus naphthalenovorans TaxID=162209 RepID=UPI003D2C99AE